MNSEMNISENNSISATSSTSTSINTINELFEKLFTEKNVTKIDKIINRYTSSSLLNNKENYKAFDGIVNYIYDHFDSFEIKNLTDLNTHIVQLYVEAYSEAHHEAHSPTKERFLTSNDDPNNIPSPTNDNILVTKERQVFEFRVNLNSLDRNPYEWPAPNRYRFWINSDIPTTKKGYINDLRINNIRNIVEVKIVNAQVPKLNSTDATITDPPFLYLFIDEFNNPLTKTTIFGGNSMIGKMSNFYDKTDTRTFYLLNTDYCILNFPINQPFDSIPSITINIATQRGVLYDFGPDALIITNISAASPTIITTSIAHQLTTNNLVYINDVSDTDVPDTLNNLNGYQVTVLTPTTFSIPVAVTVGGASGIVMVAKRQNNIMISFKVVAENIADNVRD